MHSHLTGNGVRAGGFTLVELIAVMLLISILGAIGFARFSDRKAFDAIAYADQVAGLLRYGQKLAIAQNRALYVRLDGASIALCYDATCTASNRVAAIGGSNSGRTNTVSVCGSSTWACEAPPNGVAYTVSPVAASTYFYFDQLGKPFAPADTYQTATSTFNTTTISVSGDGISHNVVVEAETGYVH